MLAMSSWPAPGRLSLVVALALLSAGSHAESRSDGSATSASGASSPLEIVSARERARLLLLEGRAGEAATLYSSLLTLDPGDATSMEGRVRSLLASGRWKDALAEARRFEGANPASLDVKTALGEALYRAGLIEEAGALMEPIGVVAAAPARALVTLGLVRAAQGRDEEAAELMDRALAADPTDRDVFLSAAGAATTRAKSVLLLERYLERSAGDDPDRIEGARGTLRLYRALGERPLWVDLTRPERLELPLRPLAGAGGHSMGFVVLAALGEGKPVPLLLDTGSTGLFILERVARTRGFEPLAEETVFGGGGEGRHPANRGLFATLSLGGLRFKDALASTTPQELDPTGRYHGVIGLEVFRGYRIVLDLARNRLLLEPPSEGGQGLPYWTVSGQLLVEARTSPESTGLFLLDTGATRSLVSLSQAQATPGTRLGERAAVRGYGGAIGDARVLRGIELQCQGLRMADAPVNTADLTLRSRLGGVEIAGFLGLDFLEGKRVIVDTRFHRIALAKP